MDSVAYDVDVMGWVLGGRLRTGHVKHVMLKFNK